MTKAKLGVILSRVPFSDAVKREARNTAAAYYKDCLADDFSGDDVDVYSIPGWLPPVPEFLPTRELAAQGFKLREGRETEFLMTAGVDDHIDDIQGLTLCVVIHNDGLTFKQGRNRCTPAGGDCFIFDDAKLHSVTGGTGDDSWVFSALIVPIELM